MTRALRRFSRARWSNLGTISASALNLVFVTPDVTPLVRNYERLDLRQYVKSAINCCADPEIETHSERAGEGTPLGNSNCAVVNNARTKRWCHDARWAQPNCRSHPRVSRRAGRNEERCRPVMTRYTCITSLGPFP